METKKHPQASLENYSFQFLLIGLALTLFCTHIALEHKTYERLITQSNTVFLTAEPVDELIITHRKPIIKQTAPPPKLIEVIEIIENTTDIEESIIESNETNENEAVVASSHLDIDNINEVAEIEEIVEDVPFAIIEDIPVFPGCEKGTKAEKKACFSSSIRRHINKKFDISLANDLGLTEGKKRIFVMFTISETGEITDIQSRAPHPRLQQEAERLVKSLPKITPGKQRGRPVRVKYSLPITFEVRM